MARSRHLSAPPKVHAYDPLAKDWLAGCGQFGCKQEIWHDSKSVEEGDRRFERVGTSRWAWKGQGGRIERADDIVTCNSRKRDLRERYE